MALSEDLPVVRLDGQVALVTGAGRAIGRPGSGRSGRSRNMRRWTICETG